ncbi:MAG: adenylyltransferase/cytidyltransferase family protein [bacterium]
MSRIIVDGLSLLQGAQTLKGTNIVLVGGCFDVIHFGHVAFLKAAKKTGDMLVVALENDEFIRTRKNREPFHTHIQRAEMLSELRTVDTVVMLPVMQGTEDYLTLVQRIHPSVIAVTTGDTQLSNKQLFADRVGARLIEVCGPISGLSSSTLLHYDHLLYD